MRLEERIESFAELGRVLRESIAGNITGYYALIEDKIISQQFSNPWFTPENVRKEIKSVAMELTMENLI